MSNPKTPAMMRLSAVFLQVVIVLIGVGALAFMLWEPHIEGRNAHATPSEIYFKDPFLAYAYFASIPLFVALLQAFKVLGYSRENKALSLAAVKALRKMKRCAITLIGFVAIGEVFILLGSSDDHAGGVFMGILISSASVIVAAAATTLEGILQSGMNREFEKDMTV